MTRGGNAGPVWILNPPLSRESLRADVKLDDDYAVICAVSMLHSLKGNHVAVCM